MVEPGTKLKAIVTRIEEYGVWLDYQGQQVLVLVPELSWSPARTNEMVQVGMELEVVIVRYNYKDRVIVASVRQVDPEKNPYRAIARLDPDAVLTGTVKGYSAGDVRIDLPNGAIGYIRAGHQVQKGNGSLQVGDPVQVRVAALEVDQGHLTLEPVAALIPGKD